MKVKRAVWKSVLWRVSVILSMAFMSVMSPQAHGLKADGIDDEMRREFQRRIDGYMAIQKKAMATVSPLPKEGVTDVSLIEAHEQGLADAVRALRPNATRGDLFSPGIATMFSLTLRELMKGPSGESVKETIFGEGNPESAESPAVVVVAVNAGYPSDAPLSTMPPSLLFALPPLPRGLEYRFVGHTLILLDTQANLIVDAILSAV